MWLCFVARWGCVVMFLMPAGSTGGMRLCFRCPVRACGYVFDARWGYVVMFWMPAGSAGGMWLRFGCPRVACGYVFDARWGRVRGDVVMFLMSAGGMWLRFGCLRGACGYVFDARWGRVGVMWLCFVARWVCVVMFLMPTGSTGGMRLWF